MSVGLSQTVSSSDQVLTITHTVYKALHPVEQLMVQSLQQIEKIRIIDENEE